ncbi:radical SAM protein [Candidatus Margulisiibacteriota bacterium]
MPAQEYIFKLLPACNINCTYCYQNNYNKKRKNTANSIMSPEKFETCLQAACENSFNNGLESISVNLQGGEPLLAGIPRFRKYLQTCRKLEKEYQKKINISIQTNGILLNEDWCDLLMEMNCSVGVSFDGPPEVNDLYRKTIDNKGVSKQIIKGIQMALRYELSVGTISVINPGIKGNEVYHFIKGLGIKKMHFLFTAQNWIFNFFPSNPDCTIIADYLLSVFHEWGNDSDSKIQIPMLSNIIKACAGAVVSGSSLINTPGEWIVFSHDGYIESGDCYGICENRKIMDDNPYNAIKAQEQTSLYIMQKNGDIIPDKCCNCEFACICKGGSLPFRYSRENGYNNPSYYCEDIKKILLYFRNAINSLN